MTQFSDLKLDPKVLKAIEEAGYTTPTPIQAGAIPPALEGRDVLGIAQTGTGKTASFTLPMITLLGRGRARARMPRSLVLCPTRELAAQVAENFDIYAKHTRLTKALLIGGVSMREQEMLIDRGVDVLIATPGRLLDHFERGNLLLQGVQIMVVDEADRMLDMGFIPDIERIFQLTPFTRQTLFFSATMAPEIERITNTFLNSPERIEVARQATTSETITQKLIQLTPTRKDQTAKQKRELLRALIDAEGPADQQGGLKNAIIFCNRKTEVDIVAKSLKTHGYDAAPIHGDLDQRQRTATLDGFRDGSLRFLIASDVAARGLDIPAVSHVFNFDLPSHAEDYVHRIGRTGRAGLRGTAISISTPADEKYLGAIENLVKHELPRADLPEGFSLSDPARSESRETRESDRGDRSGSSRGGSRTRSRSRKDGGHADAGRQDTTTHQDAPALPEAVEVTADAAPIDLPEAKPNGHGVRNGERGNGTGSREQRAVHERPAERRDQRPQDRRDDRKDDRRDRSRDRDRGPAVMGMGDHVPDFLLTSFRTADTSATDAVHADAAKPDTAPAEPQATSEAAAVTEKPAPKRRTRSRKPAQADVAAAETPAAELPAGDMPEAKVEAQTAPDVAPEAEEKPKPKRAPRSRKKKEAAAPDVPSDASAAPAEKLPEEVEAERHPVPTDSSDQQAAPTQNDTTAAGAEATDTQGSSDAQPENTQG